VTIPPQPKPHKPAGKTYMIDNELKQTILKMLHTELAAMNYYQRACELIRDIGANYHFNLLAQEELEHARAFYNVYPEDDLPEFEDMVRKASEQKIDELLIDPKLLARLNERTALQLGMKMEQTVVETLKKNLLEISSPAARAVIEENIESTLSHYEIIKEDYLRLFDTTAGSAAS
jgi:rubrerythrin